MIEKIKQLFAIIDEIHEIAEQNGICLCTDFVQTLITKDDRKCIHVLRGIEKLQTDENKIELTDSGSTSYPIKKTILVDGIDFFQIDNR